MEGIKGEGAENDVALESILRRASAPRKATLGKKIKDEASETEDEDEAFERVGAPPKSSVGEKKKAANGTANGTGQASKSQGNKKEVATAKVCVKVPCAKCASTNNSLLQEGNADETAR